VVLVWGTLKIFRGLDTAFSEIYETEAENSLVDQLIDGLVVLVALGVAILATIGVSSAFAAFAGQVPGLGLLTPVVLLAGLVLAFLPMYYRFPDTDLGWRDVLPGTVVAAVGWAALQSVFQVYLAFRGGGSESFFGGVVVVVTWLYFSGLVLLLGAVLNAVVGGHSTGSPGGVGRGAARDSSDVDARRSLDRDELASYLRDLRERVTGYHEELEPASEPTAHSRPAAGVEETQLVGTVTRVRPTDPARDDVEVVERSREDGDVREMTVTFRWRDGRNEAAD
jgi:membrane protein